jgi:hypothetical protein|tara:strand:- start:203 stop:466 length:264 start_codon:yes stop_codon:yes gene_type:complete
MEKLLIQEWGIVGCLLALFFGQIMFLQKTLLKKLQDTDDKVIALINRWNRSDEINSSARDRRHEQILEQVNRITDNQNFIKGKINGR